jgi:uncharacterized membrane protein YphA (DoxX/SURF4 family)
MAWLRIVTSLAWLDSAFVGKDAKVSAEFLSGSGLVKAVNEKFLHFAITPGVADALRTVVLPHAQLFAILIAVADLATGLSLSLGLLTRVGCAIAILRAMTNILVAGGAGPDTVGFNAMLIAAAILVIVTRAGRRFGLDRRLAERHPDSPIVRLLT